MAAPSGWRRATLSRQFAGAAAALAATAVLLIAVGSWWWVRGLQQESERLLRQRDVDLRATQVHETLQRIQERLVEIASSPLLGNALTDSSGRDSYLQPYLGSVQVVDAIPIELQLVDFEGHEIARNGDIADAKAHSASFKRLMQHMPANAALAAASEGDDVLLAAAVRYARTGTVEGALWVRLSAASLLRDPSYRLLSSAEAARQTDLRWQAPVRLDPALAGLDFVVVHQGPPVQALGSGPQALAWAVGAAVLIVAGVGLVGKGLSRRLTADLRALDTFARSVAERSFGDERAPVGGAREVAGLAESLNRMLDRLNEQHTALQGEKQAQLNLLAACIRNLNDVVLITEATPTLDGAHRIVFVNEAFERTTGYRRDEVIGRTPRLLQGPGTDSAELARIGAALRRWEPVRAEVLNYAKDGRTYWVEMEIVPVKDTTGTVLNWLAVERDVTARRAAETTRADLERQVREAQKMEAIGTLAGGIAHDFNNILAAILGNLKLAQQDMAAGRPVDERLAQLGRSAERARALVKQILTYSRRTEQALAPLDLKVCMHETVALLRAAVPARVQLEETLCEEPVHVLGDAVALEQVLMNLGTNAWHALQGSTGRVRFGLDTVAPPGSGGPVGACAHLWVQDDGCGMDAATQARIFEPFFTTKPVGSGTGLGLSVVQGIVQTHGGTITVSSSPGAGTTFHIHLPLCAQPLQPPGGAAGAVVRGHGEQVLYVDDDVVIVEVASALLRHWGYRVTALGSVAEAIAALRADPERFDLIVTDYNMPGLSGLDLLHEVQRLRPGLPLILTSGYLGDDVRAAAWAAGVRALLHKENIQDELAGLAAQALRGSPPAGAAGPGSGPPSAPPA